MKIAIRATLLVLCTAATMGVSHCERGDELAFAPAACFSSWSEGGFRGASILPVVVARRTYSGLYVPAEVVLEITTCGASLTTISEGAVEKRGPFRFDPREVRELHDALAEAGAGDITGYTDCAMTTGHDTSTEITFFEPSLVPGRAWANRFAFGNCSLDPRAGDVSQVLSAWVTDHFEARRF